MSAAEFTPSPRAPGGVSLIGVPTDVGAGTLGARMGPEALRVAGVAQAIAQFGIEVRDCGNLSGPANPWQDAVNGFRHLPEVVQWNQLLHDALYAELRAGRLPIMLGGDHCLGIGSISAVARHCRDTGKKLRVLWFDAHADFNTATLTPSGNIHGMPVACLCGQGPPELVGIGGHVPALNPRDLRQIGIRSVDAGEKRLVHDMGIEVFDMRYIDEMGMRHALEQALQGVDDDTHVHVSLD
ncbi:MAG: arginase, partial [Polaromonas sp.]|nr:arginase [Polaromonas sp.]